MTIEELAEATLSFLRRRGQTLATAESLTGGGVGMLLTTVPGSSENYRGGVISYTDEVKHRVLGVPSGILETDGAVSAGTAAAMAEGVKTVCGADWAISTTGLAGPGGDGSGKPVGLVYTAVSGPEGTESFVHRFSGGREDVRGKACRAALEELLRKLGGDP